MSVNYYVTSKDADFVFNKMPGAEMNYEDRRFEIHLAQIAGCNKPLLQHTSVFSNWKELTAYLQENKKYILIVDEYNVPYNCEEFIKMMIGNNTTGDSRFGKYPEIMTKSDYYKDSDGYEWCKLDFC